MGPVSFKVGGGGGGGGGGCGGKEYFNPLVFQAQILKKKTISELSYLYTEESKSVSDLVLKGHYLNGLSENE